MNTDVYLSFIIEEYEKGRIDDATLIRKVTTHLEEKGYKRPEINVFLSRTLKEKSFEEKKSFLSKLRFKNGELKYGDIINNADKETVSKLYEREAMLTDYMSYVNYDNSEKDFSQGEYHIKFDKTEVEKKEEPEKDFSAGEYHIKFDKPEVEKKEEPEKDFSAGEYHIKFDRNKSKVFDDVELTDEEIKEAKKNAVDFENIVNNISKEEESNVKKVEVPKERQEKLKESKLKLNKKKVLIEAAAVVGLIITSSPLSVALSAAEIAVFVYAVKHSKYKPKTGFGLAIRDVCHKVADTLNPVSYEEKSK